MISILLHSFEEMAITSKMAMVLIVLVALCLLSDAAMGRRGRGGGGGGGDDSGSSNLSSFDYGFLYLLISCLSYIIFLYSPY